LWPAPNQGEVVSRASVHRPDGPFEPTASHAADIIGFGVILKHAGRTEHGVRAGEELGGDIVTPEAELPLSCPSGGIVTERRRVHVRDGCETIDRWLFVAKERLRLDAEVVQEGHDRAAQVEVRESRREGKRCFDVVECHVRK
jgi:hypothetical protein